MNRWRLLAVFLFALKIDLLRSTVLNRLVANFVDVNKIAC
nr:MAG TPA: hypothetical protein [Caudoviricetes sp.]